MFRWLAHIILLFLPRCVQDGQRKSNQDSLFKKSIPSGQASYIEEDNVGLAGNEFEAKENNHLVKVENDVSMQRF